jgi:fucose permease
MGAALLLMSVVGGGIFPVIFGRLIDLNPAYSQTAVLMLIPCFLYLFFYGKWGHKINSWKLVPAAEPAVGIIK